MSHSGFQSDAAFFDLMAHSADPKDRQHLRQVAATYRTLAKNGGADSASREEHWSNRAAKCRELSEQFENPACHTQLLRLAETYDLLAETCRKRSPRRKAASDDDLTSPPASPPDSRTNGSGSRGSSPF
jgi:hypothetical protein